MVARLEPLNATGRAVLAYDVLPFIPLFALGRRESLTFDWHQAIEIRMPSAFDTNRSARGRSN